MKTNRNKKVIIDTMRLNEWWHWWQYYANLLTEKGDNIDPLTIETEDEYFTAEEIRKILNTINSNKFPAPGEGGYP